MSFADIIVIAILVVAVVAALIFIRRRQKCGGTCVGCPMSSECEKNRKSAL